MIETRILSVRNPIWANDDHSAIDCLITSNILIGEHLFTASKYDPEYYGRKLYSELIEGCYGEIQELSLKNDTEEVLDVKCNYSYEEYKRLNDFFSVTNDENNKKSFRGTIIAWSSFLDSLLEELLRNDKLLLRVKNKKSSKSFQKRIEIALDSDLINQSDYDKLNCIRLIRNSVAHEWDASLKAEGLIDNLKKLYDFDHAKFIKFYSDLDFLIQKVYSSSCAIIANNIVKKIYSNAIC